MDHVSYNLVCGRRQPHPHTRLIIDKMFFLVRRIPDSVFYLKTTQLSQISPFYPAIKFNKRFIKHHIEWTVGYPQFFGAVNNCTETIT